MTIHKSVEAARPMPDYNIGYTCIPVTDLACLTDDSKRKVLLDLANRFWCLEHKNARIWLTGYGEGGFQVWSHVHDPYYEVCEIYRGPGFSEAIEAIVDTYLYLEDRSWRPLDYRGISEPFTKIKTEPMHPAFVTVVTDAVTRDKSRGKS